MRRPRRWHRDSGSQPLSAIERERGYIHADERGDGHSQCHTDPRSDGYSHGGGDPPAGYDGAVHSAAAYGATLYTAADANTGQISDANTGQIGDSDTVPDGDTEDVPHADCKGEFNAVPHGIVRCTLRFGCTGRAALFGGWFRRFAAAARNAQS